MIRIQQILELLSTRGVEFIIIGGVAANAHGSSYATFDLDLCYGRNRANLERLAETLLSIHAKLRNGPPDLPFTPDAQTLRSGLNFTLDTDLGPVDLLGEVLGVGMYEQAIKAAEFIELFGHQCAVLSLPQLIAAKRAAGRTKDLLMLPELEALLEHQQADLAPDDTTNS